MKTLILACTLVSITLAQLCASQINGTSGRVMVDVEETCFSTMITVPAGSFEMGDSVSNCTQASRIVELTGDCQIGRTEVTNLEFLAALRLAYEMGWVTANSGAVLDHLDGSDKIILDLGSKFSEILFEDGKFSLRPSHSEFAREAHPDGYAPDDHPVKEVSWYGAAAYCDWLSLAADLPRAYDHRTWECNGGDPYGAEGYRLPTEAEWERAARWPDGRSYAWGEEPPSPSRVNANLGLGWSSPVGSYAPSALGFSDLSGNVWEWCNDWKDCIEDSLSRINPVGPDSAVSRVQKGGSWRHAPEALRSAGCRGGYAYNTYAYVGFRICRSVIDP